MKLGVMRVSVLSIAVALGMVTAEIATHASEAGPISERTPVLVAQGTIVPERPQVAEPISENVRVLVGHWRKTTIVFEQPEDEHLVLHADGTAEDWVVTASSR